MNLLSKIVLWLSTDIPTYTGRIFALLSFLALCFPSLGLPFKGVYVLYWVVYCFVLVLMTAYYIDKYKKTFVDKMTPKQKYIFKSLIELK